MRFLKPKNGNVRTSRRTLSHGACLFALLFFFLMLHACQPSAYAAQRQDYRQRLLGAMERELSRSMDTLKLEKFKAPYFISYTVKLNETKTLIVRYESVFHSSRTSEGDLYVEVRVGDYSFDNTGGKSGFPFGIPLNLGLPVSEKAPADANETALRNALWLLTDQEYKRALSEYQKKIGDSVYQKPEGEIASFTKEEPERFIGKTKAHDFDEKKWRKRLKEVSALFREYPEITQSSTRLLADKTVRLFVNSEGAKIADESVIYSMTVEAETRAEDDMVLTNSRAFYAPSDEEFPSMSVVEKGVKAMIKELLALRKAPLLDPYSGPAILSPKATGVLFHEAVGHRLEGERQIDDDEGGTYKGRVGMEILPSFLSLVDDPTMRAFEQTPLNGFYRYDDEGVKARRVKLVEKGVLRNYLMGRTPIEGFEQSNGHGRASGSRKPMARMANTMLLSEKEVSYETLKAKMIAMIKAQGKPYGLLIQDMEGGSTNTSSFGYQAYKGIPRIVYRVYPDGREELVRGVEMVGTPIASINKIVLTGDEYGVFNGFCGAESGYVPVSAIAPAVLLEEMELQRKKKDKNRPPILPSPYNAKGQKQGK